MVESEETSAIEEYDQRMGLQERKQFQMRQTSSPAHDPNSVEFVSTRQVAADLLEAVEWIETCTLRNKQKRNESRGSLLCDLFTTVQLRTRLRTWHGELPVG